jgi:dUTP diphosphatase
MPPARARGYGAIGWPVSLGAPDPMGAIDLHGCPRAQAQTASRSASRCSQRCSAGSTGRLAHPMDVPILRLHDSVQQPTYATAGSNGFDLCTAQDVQIAPGEIALVGTGLVFATPPGWCLLVCLRSSTPRKFGVIQPHAIGIIDEDYQGPADELRLQLLNFTAESQSIPAGSRIAQGVFVRTGRAQWSVHDPGATSRGGFGSTGE